MDEKTDEFAYIDWIRKRTANHPRVPIGIGDDAAAIRFPTPADCLVAADMLMENVHFRLADHSPREIGRKALAVNLSDIAAMAGRPLAAFVTVALPRKHGTVLARELHEGIEALANEFHLVVAGGDTNVWDGALVVSVTVVGEAGPRGIVRRGGAKPDDAVFVTGSLGGSLARKHIHFTPRILEASLLSEAVELHAMIDVSDGLAADLHHILEESDVGAELIANSIPISESARAAADGRNPLDHALGDGEDFELLFTVAAIDAERVLKLQLPNCPITRIGEITTGRDCVLIQSDGTRLPLPPKGWSHRF
ncbi:MAG: thiamine-monophosphate kinase [Planctomycetaceae bacterium]